MVQIVATFKGRKIRIPSAEIEGRRVIATGFALRTATLRDEELVEGKLVHREVCRRFL